MINAKEVGDYIKRKRKSLGMTQADLGNRLNTTCQNVSKWEGGKSVPTTDMLTDLSEAKMQHKQYPERRKRKNGRTGRTIIGLRKNI